jgi:hypothetical protein
MEEKKMKKIVLLILSATMVASLLTGCTDANRADMLAQQEVSKDLVTAQPTPTDINYSLERYNLIRRAYWVNGQREKANALICEVVKPLGYITLFTESGAIVGTFVVDGKVSSLNSYLTPDSEYYSSGDTYNDWLADIDGSYGTNDSGIFFFTVDGNYIEWTGTYLYTDIPMKVETPVIQFGQGQAQ